MAHLKHMLDESAPAVHSNETLSKYALRTMLDAEHGAGRRQSRWQLRVGVVLGLATALLAGQVSVAVGLPGLIAEALTPGPDHTVAVTADSASCDFTIRVAPALTSQTTSDSTEEGLRAAEEFVASLDLASIDTALEEQSQAKQLDPSTPPVTIKGMALVMVVSGMVAEELESQGYSESASMEWSADCSHTK